MRLKSVDLPTFGRPTIATTGSAAGADLDAVAAMRLEAQLRQAAADRRPARLDADEELEEHPRAEQRLEARAGPRPDVAQALAAAADDDRPCGSDASTRIVAAITVRLCVRLLLESLDDDRRVP